MRFRNMPGVRHIRNARVRGDMMREETRAAMAVAQAGMNVYWDDYERAHFARTDLEKAEAEAYARNFAMDQQEARLRELTDGNGPGYEEVPAWLRVTGVPGPSEVEANERYLDWFDDEYDGYEKGNPPKSRELDEVTEAASTWYREHRDWPTTEVQRGENGQWEFEDWAQAHGYSDDDVARTYDVEGVRESRLAQREGQQMVDEIQRMADDPRYADVRDQIEDISGYVRQVMELGEPGR